MPQLEAIEAADATKLRIYAVPRTANGGYWIHDAKTTVIKNFGSPDARESFWQTEIVPKTRSRPGPDYEYRMVNERDSAWSYASPPRYSNERLITGTKTNGHANVAEA